jgi:hypothetical protein
VVPVANPVTTPVVEPTVPTVTFVLLHVPPVVAFVSVMVEPKHTVDGPAIVSGNGLTVNVNVAVQPLATE